MPFCRTCDGHRATRGCKKGGIGDMEKLCRDCIGMFELDLRTIYKFYTVSKVRYYL